MLQRRRQGNESLQIDVEFKKLLERDDAHNCERNEAPICFGDPQKFSPLHCLYSGEEICRDQDEHDLCGHGGEPESSSLIAGWNYPE